MLKQINFHSETIWKMDFAKIQCHAESTVKDIYVIDGICTSSYAGNKCNSEERKISKNALFLVKNT